jgi:hypothetical protein
VRDLLDAVSRVELRAGLEIATVTHNGLSRHAHGVFSPMTRGAPFV